MTGIIKAVVEMKNINFQLTIILTNLLKYGLFLHLNFEL